MQTCVAPWLLPHLPECAARGLPCGDHAAGARAGARARAEALKFSEEGGHAGGVRGGGFGARGRPNLP